MRALKLLEGGLVNPRLQERSCWDCWNSDAVVALTLVVQSTAVVYRSNMSALIVLCHVNFYMEPVAPRGVPAKRVCVFFLFIPGFIFLVHISMFVVVLCSYAGTARC